MSGAIKHMERSHRNYGKNHSEFGVFRARAGFSKSNSKAMKEHGLIASLFLRFMSHTKKGVK